MPLYQYRCRTCEKVHDVSARMGEASAPVCCGKETLRIYQAHICASRWVSREENRLGWISETDLKRQRAEWDKRYEEKLSQRDIPEVSREKSLVECAKETGLLKV